MRVTTRGDGKPNKSCCDIRALAETKTKGTSKKIMSRHRFKVATRKEDIVGRNREIMSRPEVMLNGLAMSLLGNFRLRQRYKLETPIKVATYF